MWRIRDSWCVRVVTWREGVLAVGEVVIRVAAVLTVINYLKEVVLGAHDGVGRQGSALVDDFLVQRNN